MANTLAVVDYGMGNLRSVGKALERVGGRVVLATQARQIEAADRVVFPGVGAIRDCLAAVERQGIREALLEAIRSKPFLGICLGMQALLETSLEHGEHAALGVIPGQVVPFPSGPTASGLKVPHMGWNRVECSQPEHPLWHGLDAAPYCYFVHSYFVDPADPGWVLATTVHGLRFTSVVARANLFAVQFHPEKSSQIGLRLLANFTAWDPR